RISLLAADINQQKEVLKQLEARKSALQLQLNAILDPITRLPFDISSEIFVECMPTHPKPGGHLIPPLFLKICRWWTNIAFTTSRLWSEIHADSP
ncbi:hypothetical protein DFH09DRAFT_883547, partial [Mycena vulgaris]